jgi:hypothetical protein
MRHDVLTPVDRAVHAGFRRVQADKTPGYPRLQGAHRSISCTHTQVDNGAPSILASLASRSARRADVWRCTGRVRLRARPRRTRSQMKRTAATSVARVRVCPATSRTRGGRAPHAGALALVRQDDTNSPRTCRRLTCPGIRSWPRPSPTPAGTPPADTSQTRSGCDCDCTCGELVDTGVAVRWHARPCVEWRAPAAGLHRRQEQ